MHWRVKGYELPGEIGKFGKHCIRPLGASEQNRVKTPQHPLGSDPLGKALEDSKSPGFLRKMFFQVLAGGEGELEK